VNVTAPDQLPLTAAGREPGGVVCKLPSELGHAEIRALSSELLEQRPQTITLDLRSFKRCEPTAEAHLLDLLTLCLRIGAPARLLVNTTSTPGSNGLADRYRRLFTGPLAGILLARFAAGVSDERGGDHSAEVAELVRDAPRTDSGLLWHGPQRAALITADPQDPQAAITTESRPKPLQQLVLDELRDMELSAFEDVLAPIANCVQQAIQNVRLHSAVQLPRSQDESFGFVSLRRVIRPETAQLATVSSEPLREYWESAALARAPERHLVLTVADNGGGIPATMAGSRAVYQADDESEPEVKQLLLALGPGTSDRDSGQGRGLGLPQMLDAIFDRKGLMIVRTGRVRAHALREERGGPPRLAAVQRLPFSIGTTLVFLFPEPRTDSRRR
jgi:hypothetical protein